MMDAKDDEDSMNGDMMGADGMPMRKKKSRIKMSVRKKKDESGVEIIEPTATMVNEWFTLKDSDKQTIVRTWKSAWPFRKEICHELALLAEPFGADPVNDTMNGVTLQVILDAYNACVGFIKEDLKQKMKEKREKGYSDADLSSSSSEAEEEEVEETYEGDEEAEEEADYQAEEEPVRRSSVMSLPNMDDAPPSDAEFTEPEESPIKDGDMTKRKSKGAARPADAVKDPAFFKIVRYLSRIAALHRAKGLNPNHVLSTRAWLILCFKKLLGGLFSEEVRSAWLGLSSVVVLTLITDSVASLGPKPSKRDVWVVAQTWQVVEQNGDRGDALFLNTLFSLSNEAKEVLEGRNFPLVRSFSKVVHQASQPRTFQTMLERLGAQHYDFNVKPGLFKPAKRAMWAMLAEVLGVMWDDQAVLSWNKLWNYTTRIMASALRQTWMIHLPAEPFVVRLSIKIKHLKSINPIKLCFFSEQEYDCWDGNIPSRNFAFEKGETENIESPWNVKLTNGESVVNDFEKNNLSKVAKVGSNYWHRRHVRGKFSQFFDLHDYPFDAHHLRFYYLLSIPVEEAHFTTEKKGITIKFEKDASLYGIGGAEWDVYKPRSKIVRIKRGRKKHEQVMVSLPITRRYHNFMYQVLGPLFLIDVVGFLSYFVEHKPTFYRFSVLAPLLLTMFSFKWTLSKQIPPVPYLTKFDVFFNQSYLFFVVHTTMTLMVKALDEVDHSYHTIFFLGTLFIAILGCLFARIRLLQECINIATEHREILDDNSGKKQLLNTEEALQKRNYENGEREATLSLGSTSQSASNSASTGGSIASNL